MELPFAPMERPSSPSSPIGTAAAHWPTGHLPICMTAPRPSVPLFSCPPPLPPAVCAPPGTFAHVARPWLRHPPAAQFFAISPSLRPNPLHIPCHTPLPLPHTPLVQPIPNPFRHARLATPPLRPLPHHRDPVVAHWSGWPAQSVQCMRCALQEG